MKKPHKIILVDDLGMVKNLDHHGTLATAKGRALFERRFCGPESRVSILTNRGTRWAWDNSYGRWVHDTGRKG